jgi:formamidopyrimidine-DNA glycosylase
MPELPEVETIRRNLARTIKGKRIRRLTILQPAMVKREITPPMLAKRARNRFITAVKRRGKALLMFLDSPEVIVFRLGMTGQILWSHPGRPVRRDKHTHVIIEFGTGERLLFRDPRRFGEMYLTGKGNIERILRMGTEPLHRNFTPVVLNGVINSRVRIKQLLLDQKRIAGIGNIYSDEILFEAGIHPCTPSCSIKGVRLGKLHKAVCLILREAIACNGDTVSDYRTAFNENGSYQDNHRVYQRQGEPCLRCGTPIERMRLGGRSSHYCPKCQK